MIYAFPVSITNWPQPSPDSLLTWSTVILAAGTVALAIGTCALAVIAWRALSYSKKQLNAQFETAQTERTIKLIQEASSPENFGKLLDFFDFASDVDVSRKTIQKLCSQVLDAERSRTSILRSGDEASIKEEMLMDLDHVYSAERLREIELRKRIVEATDFLENVRDFVERKTVDVELLFENQDYNIVTVYYVLEDVLKDLTEKEDFDFEAAREIAVLAQNSLRLRRSARGGWPRENHPLLLAKFSAFPKASEATNASG